MVFLHQSSHRVSIPRVPLVIIDAMADRSCPYSAVTAVLLLYFLRLNTGNNPLNTLGARQFLWSLDPLGLSLFVGAITCCLMALEVRDINLIASAS